jgi:hypothetical protein
MNIEDFNPEEFLRDAKTGKQLAIEALTEHDRLLEWAEELYAQVETGKLTKDEAKAQWDAKWLPFRRYCSGLVTEVVEPLKETLALLGIFPHEGEDQP